MPTLAAQPDLHVAASSMGSGLGWTALFFAGLLAWAFGGRLLKFLIVTSGITLGAWVGSRIASGGNPIPVLMGAGVGVLGSLAAHRFVVISLAGSTLAGLGILAAFAWLSITHHPLAELQRAQAVIESSPLESEEAAVYRRAATEAFEAVARDNEIAAAKDILRNTDAGPAARVAEHVGRGFESIWNEIPESTRRIIQLTAVVCAIAGGVLAIADARTAAAMVTAIGGSAAMLISGYHLAPHAGISVPVAEAMHPALVAAGWLVLSGLGVHRQRQDRVKSDRSSGGRPRQGFKGGTPCGAGCGS